MILVTGANGYIGRNFIKRLAEEDLEFVGIDNFTTSERDTFTEEFNILDICLSDFSTLVSLTNQFQFTTVVHLAASAYVNESFFDPKKYFYNNGLNTLNLLRVMEKGNIKNMVFASSCTVYAPSSEPLLESSPIEPHSNYGLSKWLAEEIIRSFCLQSSFQAISLRFFNVIGGQRDGTLCDNHNPETHLLPSLIKACLEGLEFRINGTDFPTKDGTAERDYTHVRDIVNGIFLCIRKLESGIEPNFLCINLGSESPKSIIEILKTVERTIGVSPNLQFGERRVGDVPVAFANSCLAKTYLDWNTQSSIQDAIFEEMLSKKTLR